MVAERQRPLITALVASLVLHALVLSLRSPAVKPASPYSAPLVTRLARAEPPSLALPPIAKQAPLPTPKPRAPAPPVQAAVPLTQPPVEAQARAAVDAGAVARYRYELIATALRYQRAAAHSLEAAEGEVALSIGIRANGERALGVKASSGQALLDAHALELFRLALADVALPLALRGQEFALDVRALYSRDQ